MFISQFTIFYLSVIHLFLLHSSYYQCYDKESKRCKARCQEGNGQSLHETKSHGHPIPESDPEEIENFKKELKVNVLVSSDKLRPEYDKVAAK